MKTTEEPLAENKKLNSRDQVVARLKAIGCWPVPEAVVDRLVLKVNTKIAAIMGETIKGFGSVASAMAEIEKEGGPKDKAE